MTRRTMSALSAVFACLAIFAGANASGADSEFMGLDEITPGMKGKARTVFAGTRVEEFDIEIVGVMRNWRPGGSLILGRASGERIQEVGIAAGMSGTPVYVGGRLIGAISFTWPFAKEPVAGITPIEEMLDVGRRLTGQRSASASTSGFSPGRSDAGLSGMKEIDTPIMVAGFHPAVVGLMREELAKYNMVVAQTGIGPHAGSKTEVAKQREVSAQSGAYAETYAGVSGSSASTTGAGSSSGADSGVEADASTLTAGGPLAVQLVSGDAVVSAIGTVTLVQGKHVLGFGHGLFSGGPVDVPMSSAYIHAVLPSLMSSLKLGSATRILGTITGDGEAGVTGEMGRPPDLIPVEVSVSEAGSVTTAYRFDVIRHRVLTPSLAAWAVASSALSTVGSVGEMTVRMKASVGLLGDDSKPRVVKFEHAFFTTSSAAPLTEFLSSVVGAVMNNDFESPRLTSVKCELSVAREQRVAQIDAVYVTSDEAVPGDSVTLAVRLRPRGQRAFTKLLSVRLPEGLRGESISFKVCSAPEMTEWEELVTSRKPEPQNLRQLLERIEAAGRGNVVECSAYVETGDAEVEGETFPSPPESLSRVMENRRRAGGMSETTVAVVCQTSWGTEYAVTGCQTVSVKLAEPRIRR